MHRKSKIWIGTSGWHYKHWVGTFYPEGTRPDQQLEYYRRFFNTVELNNPFYRLPRPIVFKNWRKKTPAGFLFAVKASRYITHNKKLKVEKKSIRLFFDSVKNLKEKLGPILFQLPPSWKINAKRLEEFLKTLPKKYHYTFEFRNHTWYNKEVYELLHKHNCAFCIYELQHHLSPLEITADFVYIRLHGPENKYQGRYSTAKLKTWVKKCTQWQKEGKDVYVYFDNDQKGYAASNAKQLLSMVKTQKKRK